MILDFLYCILKAVRLVSETFNYTAIDRAMASSKRRAAERFPGTIGKHVKLGLPPKVKEDHYDKIVEQT